VKAATRLPWLDTHQVAAAGAGLRLVSRAVLPPLRRLGPVVPLFLIVQSQYTAPVRPHDTRARVVVAKLLVHGSALMNLGATAKLDWLP
jgi:hypothetical protein